MTASALTVARMQRDENARHLNIMEAKVHNIGAELARHMDAGDDSPAALLNTLARIAAEVERT